MIALKIHNIADIQERSRLSHKIVNVSIKVLIRLYVKIIIIIRKYIRSLYGKY